MKQNVVFRVVCTNLPARKPLDFLDWSYSPQSFFNHLRYYSSMGWSGFRKGHKENMKVWVIFKPRKLEVVVYMRPNHYNTGLCNSLLSIKKHYPECFIASKRSLKWLESIRF